ncbi:hypothetical protein [Pseudonocardia sp. TRM90224]|uniref:hypothetical protein n=1 Tax=Pseudonocardia sp. TRM90224 TaxID=2812678 RepID=UPI001E4B70ED|nr:hypothetical protein [Pseudonocardia sp. TRM90224]
MPPDLSFITTHIHVDGPIPGPHSLLSVHAVAKGHGRDQIGTFATNVRELPGATLHPVAFQNWRRRAEDWLTTRRNSHPPAVAMTAFTRWIHDLPGPKVLVADTTHQDFLFLFWYLQRFTGKWPFARVSTEVDHDERLECAALCPLVGCRETSTTLVPTT